MKRYVAQKWIRALRSGAYKQGFKRLHFGGNTYCVLGVLCAIAPLKLQNSAFRQSGIKIGERIIGTDLTFQKDVLVWAGMSFYKGYCPRTNTTLTVLNDAGMSFETLANHIEANWEGL